LFQRHFFRTPFCSRKEKPPSLRGTFSIVAAYGGFRRWKTPQVGTTKS
jgi:hypothetical protein